MTKTFFETIYFPMTCEILTPGHIKCINWLQENCDFLIIGLLTEKALQGYKKCGVPFKDRKVILEAIIDSYDKVVAQNSLNPYDNLKKYKCEAIASGDGWEQEELEAMKQLNVKRIDIPFPKKYSSSKVISSLRGKS